MDQPSDSLPTASWMYLPSIRRALRLVVALSALLVLSMIGLVIAMRSGVGNPSQRAEFLEHLATLTLLITGVAMTSILLLFGKKDRVHSIGRARHGAVCTKCEYLLPDDESGTCPECGTFYTRRSNAVFWGVPYSKPDANEATTREIPPDQSDGTT